MIKRKLFSDYTISIIIANTIAFIVFYILVQLKPDETISMLALQPAAIIAGKHLWTFLTSMFMHANLTHLLVNMISLLFIGSFVEKLIGKKRFIIFYFIAGIFAGLFFVLISYFFNSNMYIPAVGASGAIFGLGGLLMILTPKIKVYVMFLIPMQLWIGILVLLFGMWIISTATGLPIGNTAHLGGLVMGVCYGFYLRRKFPRKTAMIEKYFSQ